MKGINKQRADDDFLQVRRATGVTRCVVDAAKWLTEPRSRTPVPGRAYVVWVQISRKDEVAFGEQALRPPDIKNVPRKAAVRCTSAPLPVSRFLCTTRCHVSLCSAVAERTLRGCARPRGVAEAAGAAGQG